jgi:hypothetical protein
VLLMDRYSIWPPETGECCIMKLDKQQIILITTKYLSYFINIIIIAAIAGVVGGWIYMLYQSATS